MTKSRIKIIVNTITTSRLILSIVLMCLLNYLSNYTFLILMTILFSTDFIDGFLARKYKVQTFYGSIMDSLADKTLNIALILPLIKEIPIIVSILILEVIIMVINTIGKLLGKRITTKYLGKIKMWIVAITIILGYLNLFNIYKEISMTIPIIITCTIQVAVIIDYLIYFAKQKNTKKYLDFKSKKDFINKLFDTEYYLKNN